MDRKTKFLFVGIIVIVALIIVFVMGGGKFISGNAISDDKDYSRFVSCLNEKGFILYGYHGNEYVDAQLDLFGEARDKLNVIDCSVDSDKCVGIVLFPSWKTFNQVYSSGLSLGMLARLSGCEL